MRLPRFPLALLAVALAACAPSPMPSPTAPPSSPPSATASPSSPVDAPLPNTEAGRFVAEWMRTQSTATPDEIRRFYSTRYVPSPDMEKDMPVRVARILRARREGTRRVRRVTEAGPFELTVLYANDLTGDWSTQHVRLDPSPPHLVAVSDGTDAEPPDDLAEHGALSDAALTARMDAYIDKLASHELFSGAVAISKGGRVVYQRAVGLASRAWNAPTRMDTKMNLGSMNKMFTSVAVAQLAQAGKLAYTDTLAKLVPDYPNQEAARKITVHELLTHSSGLGDYFTPEYEHMDKARLREVKDYLPLFVNAPLLFEPGTKSAYSNAGFMVLGRIVEVVSGENYFEYVRRHIYAPAGMADTDAYEMDHDTANLAIGYTRGDDGRWMNNLFLHVVKGGPAGGGFSTVPDLLRFANALEEGKLLDRAHVELITTKKIDLPWEPYGYGFGVAPVRGHPSFGHSGGFDGINGTLRVIPDLGLVVAALGNMDPPAAERVAKKGWELATQK